jgi:hypothetical protein
VHYSYCFPGYAWRWFLSLLIVKEAIEPRCIVVGPSFPVKTEPEAASVESSKAPLPTSKYSGQGTLQDPAIVSFKPGDGMRQDPRVQGGNVRESGALMSEAGEADGMCVNSLTIASNLSLLCISVSATVYPSGIDQVSTAYGISIEAATLSVSVYYLGFAFGPLYWVSCLVSSSRRLRN